MLIAILIQLNFFIKLNKDYVEPFKRLKKYKFEWFGNTSRKKSELYLLDTQSNIGYMFTIRLAKNSI